MNIEAIAAAVIIGIVLGLVGAGGSILTVPALVYLLEIEPLQATAYSLFIVGITALAGMGQYIKRKQVAWQTAFFFSIPAFIAVYLTRRVVLPALPETLWQGAEWALSKNLAIMLLFALLMLLASFSMIRKAKPKAQEEHRMRPILIVLEGLAVGFFTGLVGAGGGFLIVPALVLLAGLPMKTAVGSSLLIIAVKSLIGFLGDVAVMDMNWLLLLSFSGLTIAGIVAGAFLSHYIDGDKLKTSFGWFILLMSGYIFITEISKL